MLLSKEIRRSTSVLSPPFSHFPLLARVLAPRACLPSLLTHSLESQAVLSPPLDSSPSSHRPSFCLVPFPMTKGLPVRLVASGHANPALSTFLTYLRTSGRSTHQLPSSSVSPSVRYINNPRPKRSKSAFSPPPIPTTFAVPCFPPSLVPFLPFLNSA